MQLEVDEDSEELLTINTHKGLFRYYCLPFGVKSAPSIFQQTMDAMLTGITGATAFLDGIIVSGTSQDELLQQLICVFERIQQYGFHVCAEKCQFYRTSIKYLGFIFDKMGWRQDLENISAIKNMPAPTDIKTLHSFLSLVSQYSSFLPELHHIWSPLNHLLKKEITWNWLPECKAAFAKIKASLSTDFLTHFNPSLDML